MTTLKVIGEGERLADSRQDINENFASLDEGKVEKIDVTASPTADTIPRRTNAGDINMRLPRSTYVNDSRINSSAAVIMRNSNSGDNYHRSVTKDAFKMWFESLHGLGDANLPNKEPNNQDMYTHFFVVGKSNPNSPFNQNSVILQLLRIPPTHAVQLAFDCLGQCYTRETSDGGMTWNSWVSGTTAFRVDSKGNGHDIVRTNGGSFMKQITARGGVAMGRDDSIVIVAGDKRDEVVNNTDPNLEYLYLGADSDVYVLAGLQDGWGVRKSFKFDRNGDLTIPRGIKIANATLTQGRSEGPLRVTTPHGHIDVGPYNSSYAHIHTDRPKFHFDKPMYVNGDMFAGKGYNKRVVLEGEPTVGINHTEGNGTPISLDNGDFKVTVHDGGGNLNFKAGCDRCCTADTYKKAGDGAVKMTFNYAESDGTIIINLAPKAAAVGDTVAYDKAFQFARNGLIIGGKKALVRDDPVSNLSQDSTHRFVTDTEKATWNGKLDSTSTAANASKWGGANKTVSTAAPSGGADGDIWFQYL
ncbi:hypothetical protein [Desulfoluna butyratoxydans]|uniref:Uncharacterized protein n=1 Tax=Desulfoluna butyratoxydans TaxID=231438 RepID=A0A4U8YJC7_9BACT|nr:hypothetical protein [Desulfoluna butyratoxydans]VFQ43846.1 hypothetical protein MSL71_14870 [Desulfoluna butyratoxydans]